MTWYYQLAGYLVVAAIVYALIREQCPHRSFAVMMALLWPVIMICGFVHFIFRRRPWRP